MDAATEQMRFDPKARFRMTWLWACLALVLFTMADYFKINGRTGVHWWTDFWWTIASGGAAWLCFRASRSLVTDDRRAWRWFGLGCALWFLGMVIWDIYELVFGRMMPFPSIADFGYLGFALSIVIGGFSLVRWGQPRQEKTKLFLDMLILINVMILVFLILFYQTFFVLSQSLLSKFFALAYPVSSIASVYILLVVHGRFADGLIKRGLSFVLGGMIWNTIANIGYVTPILTQNYEAGSALDPLWIAGFLWIGLGAFWIPMGQDL
jgi:hypothetical protein